MHRTVPVIGKPAKFEGLGVCGMQMYFEHGFCINCWYKDLDSPQVKHPPFVVHFAGCQMCTGYHPEKLGECDTEFVRSYAEALVRLNGEVAKGNL